VSYNKNNYRTDKIVKFLVLLILDYAGFISVR